MKAKTIIFMDLEGTILDEGTGNITEKDLEIFIELIDKLQNETNTDVNIHLVSPVNYKTMKKIKDYIDHSITEYNLKNKRNIPRIESAACDMSGTETEEHIDRFILPLPKNVNTEKSNIGVHEKAEYVKFWYNILEEKYDVRNLVYIGNGRNDFEAMKYIKSKKGITICPKNSRTKVKEIADYIGNSFALLGVNEALSEAISYKMKPSQEDIRE